MGEAKFHPCPCCDLGGMSEVECASRIEIDREQRTFGGEAMAKLAPKLDF